MVGCITSGGESEYRTAVDNLVAWSSTRPTELMVDLRRSETSVTPVNIQKGQCVHG